MRTSFLNQQELLELNLSSIGRSVKISRYARFYNPEKITIGDYSRIDDFCILSAGEGGIIIGRNVHISCFVSILGSGKVIIEDFVSISSKTSIYSSNDDYSGDFLVGPTIDPKFTNMDHRDVHIKKHVLVGTGSVILPGITLEVGAVIGALSLVKENCSPFTMYGGVPAKFIKKRSNRLLELEKRFLEENKPPLK